MFTGIAVPLEAAAGLWLAAVALGIMAERTRQRRARTCNADPLSGLFSKAVLADAIKHADRSGANRRSAARPATRAVLRARIDQRAILHGGWDAAARAQILGQIASVMQAGVRRGDDFAALDSDGFTIIMPRTDEPAARRVAQRLRRRLAQINLPQFGGANPFTASFGIAADEADDTGENLVARALAALDAAQHLGQDHIVAASDIEDVILLPPPDPATIRA